MSFRELTDDNIVNFAMKNYNNPSCKNIEEFQEDFNRIKYVKRLFNRYETTGVLRERLILNHIITFYNVFGVVAGTRMFFNRIDKSQYPILKMSHFDILNRSLHHLYIFLTFVGSDI